MAKRKTLLDLLDEMEPAARDAFVASIRDLKSDVQIKALEAAIGRNDVQAVLRILDLGPEYFAPLDRVIAEAFDAGGGLVMQELVRDAAKQGVRVAGRFNARDARAERILRQTSSQRVTHISEGTREVIRETLSDALERGTSPRSAALDLVGRKNRLTGRREGGVVGLTPGQAETTRRARSELLSGDPAQMANYLRRKTRDRRFDPIVRRAIREGKAVKVGDAAKMMTQFEARQLRQRGEMIARTELLGALSQSKNEALEQMIDRGKVSPEQITQEWDAANDADTRSSHAAMDGQTRPFGQPFTSGNGVPLRYPGDPMAPADERINCRCITKERIDWIASLGPGD
jgi:hypothetical protein